MFTRKPRLQLEKFAIDGAKRLLQHNLPGTDIPCVSLRRGAKKTSHRYLVSHRLDAGKLNHSGPLLGLFGDKLVEVSWRA
jgi:hypothetical protein